jgi:hypothetical protein
MVREIRIDQGIIGGFEKELIEKILPQLIGSFRQRKEFWEYYFDPKQVELSLEDLDNLSNEFQIKINFDELIINI